MMMKYTIKSFNDLLPFMMDAKGFPPKYIPKNDYHILYKGDWVENIQYLSCMFMRTYNEEMIDRINWKDINWKLFTIKPLKWEGLEAPIVEAKKPQSRPIWNMLSEDEYISRIVGKARELSLKDEFCGLSDHQLIAMAHQMVKTV